MISPAPDKHIVDILIEERAPKLAASIFWPIIRPILNWVLGYKKAVFMTDHVKDISGENAFLFVSDLLKLNCEFSGFDKLPANGRVIIICNHPTGIADGVALFDVLRKFRPDIFFYANADALRICPKFDEIIIPVEWVESKRTHEKTKRTLKATHNILDEGKALAIFPSGRLARTSKGELVEEPWMASFVAIAKKYDVPILPVHIKGPDAFWFHLFDKISIELRDITLFHELLNKKGKTYILKAGDLIFPQDLDENNQTACLKLKEYVEKQLG